MLTTTEILKKVRELEIKSKKLTSELFTGEYHSAFKGKGMSFKEVREYAPGDDVRFIDWNVSARFGHPFSKVFEEERELSVTLMVDISPSQMFGTLAARKIEMAAEIAASIAFSAISNGDKVGLILYSDKLEKYIPARKGRKHGLFLVREILSAKPTRKGTALQTALKYFTNTTPRMSIAFILSDFMDGSYGDALRLAANRHDVIGIKLYDRMDRILPKVGMLHVEDPETGAVKWIDTNSDYVRYEYEKEFFRITDHSNILFRKAGADLLHIRTDEDYVKVLQAFFISRNK